MNIQLANKVLEFIAKSDCALTIWEFSAYKGYGCAVSYNGDTPWIRDGSVLRGKFGGGNTPVEAFFDMIEQYNGQNLIFRKKQIQFPTIIER